MKIKKILLSALMSLSTAMLVGEAQVLSDDIETIDYQDIKDKTSQENKVSSIDEEEHLILVNKDNSLSSNYVPSNMTTPNIPFVLDSTNEEMHMQDIASKAIEELFSTAKDEGINFLATSAFRSYDTQLETYLNRVQAKGKEIADKYVAHPGKSEHQTGLSIDITNTNRRFVKHCKEAKWLANNAHRFGFILRYPEGKEYITGISYEPWHVRYVGKHIAKNIFEKEITLEEYIENRNYKI